MAVTFKVVMTGDALEKFQRTRVAMKKGLEQAMLSQGLLVENEMKRVLSTRWGPRTGNQYPRQGGTRIHIAARKGEPPAPDYGHLLGMVSQHVEKVRQRPSVIEIGTSAVYGASLEKRGFKFLKRSAKPLHKVLRQYGKFTGLA